MHLNGFGDFHVGHSVKISGKFRHSAGFLAVEISLEPAIDEAEIECPIQQFDPRRKMLRLCDQEILLPDGLEIKDPEGNAAGLAALQPGSMVKLKGFYTAHGGFVAKKIKLRETMEFNFEQVQGAIESIDRERKILLVNGIKILVTPKTIVEHGESLVY